MAIAVSGRGCEEDAESPEHTVRQLARAARQMDRAALFELLGPRTRDHLEAAARRATDLSSRRYSALDMIGFNTGLDELARDDLVAREVSSGESNAVVELIDRRGRRHRLDLVRVDGEWRVELVE